MEYSFDASYEDHEEIERDVVIHYEYFPGCKGSFVDGLQIEPDEDESWEITSVMQDMLVAPDKRADVEIWTDDELPDDEDGELKKSRDEGFDQNVIDHINAWKEDRY